MLRDRYTFEGLEPFERRLRRKAREVAYLVVWDRTDRREEDTLGRFELTLSDALPYLEDDEDLVDREADEEELGPEDAPTEEVDPFGMASPPTENDHAPEEDDEIRCQRVLGRTAGPADFAVAAGRWLRDIAVRNMAGDQGRRFRVRAYSPKGARVVDSVSFLCRDDEPDMQLPAVAAQTEPAMPDLRIPTPSFEQVELGASTRGMKALGDYYAQWGQIVLGSVGQMQGINNAMLGRVHRDLQQSRDQVDQLVAAILDYKFAESQLRDARAASDRADDARSDLAKQALAQLGEAAKAFIAAKGVTADLAETVNVLGQSPELVAALNDPDVRELMKDPNNLQLIAGMLKQAAQQARAMRAASPPATAG